MHACVVSFLKRCKQLFPYTNKSGNCIIETEKMHSIKHAPNDIIRYGDTENTNVEGPENKHKEWVKNQGGKTNQGSSSHRTMMVHTLRKEASALLCEAVQGCTHIFIYLHIHIETVYFAYWHTAKMFSDLFCPNSKNRGRRSWLRV